MHKEVLVDFLDTFIWIYLNPWSWYICQAGYMYTSPRQQLLLQPTMPNRRKMNDLCVGSRTAQWAESLFIRSSPAPSSSVTPGCTDMSCLSFSPFFSSQTEAVSCHSGSVAVYYWPLKHMHSRKSQLFHFLRKLLIGLPFSQRCYNKSLVKLALIFSLGFPH